MSTLHNWKLVKRPKLADLNWPPSWQRALLAALKALPSLTPEEFRATTSKRAQKRTKANGKEQMAEPSATEPTAAVAVSGGSNGVD